MDLDNQDDLSNPGSPLDRSTPISDYEMGVDEMGVMKQKLGQVPWIVVEALLFRDKQKHHHRKIYSNRNHHLQSEQKTTGSAHHLPGTSCSIP